MPPSVYSPSTKPSVVVIVWDGISALQLGPYGNTTVRTPYWNRLAAESLLIEFAWADSVELGELYTSFWTGQPAYVRRRVDRRSLAALCASRQWNTRLITDDEQVAAHPAAGEFGQIILLEADELMAPAASIEETALRYFAYEAADALCNDADLTWIHARGMTRAWDAPWELRASFTDDEDPDPPEFAEPPELVLPPNAAPDLVWGIQHAYSAQMCVADDALDIMLQAIAAKCPEALVIVTGTRGYALGAHGVVGIGRTPLFGEQLHVPCLLRFPDGLAAGTRVAAISQPATLFRTIAQWLGGDSLGMGNDNHLLLHATQLVDVESDIAIAVAAGERSIRTAQWYLREVMAPEPDEQLFVKPDDRWEQNEISSRCPAEVRQQREMLEARLQLTFD